MIYIQGLRRRWLVALVTTLLAFNGKYFKKVEGKQETTILLGQRKLEPFVKRDIETPSNKKCSRVNANFC